MQSHPGGIVGPVGISEPVTHDAIEARKNHTESPAVNPGGIVGPVGISEPVTHDAIEARQNHTESPAVNQQQTLAPPTAAMNVIDSGTRDLASSEGSQAAACVGIPMDERTPQEQANVNAAIASGEALTDSRVAVQSAGAKASVPYSAATHSALPIEEDLKTIPADRLSISAVAAGTPTGEMRKSPFMACDENESNVAARKQREQNVTMADMPSSGKAPYTVPNQTDPESAAQTDESSEGTSDPSRLQAHMGNIVGGIKATMGKILHKENMVEDGHAQQMAAAEKLNRAQVATKEE